MRLLRSWGLIGAPEKTVEDLSVEELIAEGRLPDKVVAFLKSEGDRARVAQEAMLRAIGESEDARRRLAERTEEARDLSVEELIKEGHVPAKIVELLESESDRARVAQEAMLRAIAESEDVRRRLTTRQELAVKRANEDLVKAMLPVLDNLELCLQHSETEEAAPLREAIAMTLRQWYEVFERAGATRIPAERGGEFDPSLHEGVMQDPGSDLPQGTIARILQSGFSFHGRVLRPTRVVVSTGEGLSAPTAWPAEAPPRSPDTRAGAEPQRGVPDAPMAPPRDEAEVTAKRADPDGGERLPAKKAKKAPRGRRRTASPRGERKKQTKRTAARKKR
jgi:molecular chaperone GrpE